jgi:spore germination protein YaaH
MEIANKFIVDNNIELIWLEDTYQYYGGFVKDNVEYKIWLEDEKSLDYKISLVHKYNLAGIASWRKGYETANIWNSIYKSLN